jgi:glycerophosphoryl diester phosphodiesterase
MRAHHIELDVEATNDSHIVVIHDDTVGRATNGTGPVTGQSLAALQALEAGLVVWNPILERADPDLRAPRGDPCLRP